MKTVRLSIDALDAHLRRQEITEMIDQLKAESKACKELIVAELGDADRGVFANGSGYRAKLIARKEYTVPAKTFMDVRFVKRFK